MAFNASELRDNRLLQAAVDGLLAKGKEVVLKFASSEEEADFIHRWGVLTGQVGAAVGGTAGMSMGFSVGGPIGAVVGGIVGLVAGAVVGYALGAWVANFLYEIATRLGLQDLKVEKLWSWFGLRPNRLSISS